MTTVCAWHKKYFPDDPEEVIADDGLDDDQVSHGMCSDCCVKFDEEEGL